MTKTLRVAAQSVSASELEQIKALMHGMQLPTRWEWTADAANADVLLIDVDSLYGHMDWLKAQSQKRKMICLTASSMGEQDVVIARPISIGGIKHALALSAGDDLGTAGVKPAPNNAPIPTMPQRARVTGEQPVVPAAPTVLPRRVTGEQQAVPNAPTLLPRRVTAEQPAVPNAPTLLPRRVTAEQPAVTGPRPAARITGQQRVVPSAPAAAELPAQTPQLRPSANTLADFLLGDNLDQPAMLARTGLPALIVDPSGDRYYGGLTLKPLLPYCQGRIERAEWKSVPEKELNALRSGGSGLPLLRLIWLYTLGTSNGVALLPGLDANVRYKLLKWPQIEREFPKHFRIATAMMKAPTLLAEVADFAGASINEVFDFVNAYTAIGVVCPENQSPWTDRKTVLERLRARSA
ncbi:MAG: hypothetical protein SGI99_16875 [Pseudomonadota bacterium]|nr:hypothetical protein [Pseudomonadota bacterium]